MPPLYYRVFYSKDLRKKRKVTSQGLLKLDLKAALYDQQAKLITAQPLKAFLQQDKDNQYILAAYYVWMEEQISESDFLTGKCFLPKSPPPKPVKKVAVRKQPQPGYPLTESGCVLQNFIAGRLREHQLLGVKFMFQCVNGLKGNQICGGILADSMGLGKTLQAIALIWACLRTSAASPDKPLVAKAAVVCPVSLLHNWKNEFSKWLGDQKLCPLICSGTRAQSKEVVQRFVTQKNRCLIISYETFSIFAERLSESLQLIVYDEGHRLKNADTKSYRIAKATRTIRRVLLTGTPIQNNLIELFNCVSLVNPLFFPSLALFKNLFIRPIEDGLKPKVTLAALELAKTRAQQLTQQLKRFTLRRKPDLLQKYLPPRHQVFLFLQQTDLQRSLYDQVLEQVKKQPSTVLLKLVELRKLLLHPRLLANHFLKRQSSELVRVGQKQKSCKVQVLLSILEYSQRTGQKVVVVSSYTQALDFIADILAPSRCFRLDGRMNAEERTKQLSSFKASEGSDVLLLSAKAGGTGLNIVQASVMVLMEVDWNPSVDLQVMGRIWREGQTKPVRIFRLVSAHTFQENVLQRQAFKRNIEASVIDQTATTAGPSDPLTYLFQKKTESRCMTYPDSAHDPSLLSDLGIQSEGWVSLVCEAESKKQTVMQEGIDVQDAEQPVQQLQQPQTEQSLREGDQEEETCIEISYEVAKDKRQVKRTTVECVDQLTGADSKRDDVLHGRPEGERGERAGEGEGRGGDQRAGTRGPAVLRKVVME